MNSEDLDLMQLYTRQEEKGRMQKKNTDTTTESKTQHTQYDKLHK